jgi:putative ATP-dependent endonuclease of the OLD family
MRALMAATYLRALRDALDELTAGRGSRLSQILHAHPKYVAESIADFKPEDVADDGTVIMPKTLVGTMRLAEHGIEQNPAVRWTRDQLNQGYLDRLSLADDVIRGEVGITRAAELRDILEKLDLWIASIGGKTVRIKRGLGTNNILYMASEMLLLGASGEDGLPLLLIEEPEAHLHPQMQLLVGDFLREQSARSLAPDEDGAPPPLQVVATTHSPTLSSQVDLEQLVIIADGKAFPLRTGCTGLDVGDYRFLSKFLDATRANLFFARGVLIVEGDAENLLLPVLAALLGMPLNKHGVSIVNVGTVGLFRYSRIFVGPDGNARVPVRVACVTDLDLAHDAPEEEKQKRHATRRRNEGGTVRTFVSDYKTLEYVLAATSFAKEMHLAITLAKKSKNSGAPVSDAERAAIEKAAATEFSALENGSAGDAFVLAGSIYEPLAKENASKAETAQYFGELLLEAQKRGELDATSLQERLPSYLVNAIEYATWRKDFPLHAPEKTAPVEGDRATPR